MNQLDTIESKLDRILELLEKKKVARKPKVNAASTDFERFWAVYPKKVGKAKALSAWMNRKTSAKVFMITDDIENRLESDQAWQDVQYIPHPATYLNGERWLDDITPIVQKKETVPRRDQEAIAWGIARGIEAKVGEPMWKFRQRLEAVL